MAENVGLFHSPAATTEPAPDPGAQGLLPGASTQASPAQDTAGSAPPETPPASPPPMGDAGGPLLASILQDEGLRDHASIGRYKSPDALAKAYLELETKISEKGVLLPKEDASAEERTAFYKQLPGYPEAPDGYGITEEVISQLLPDGALAPGGEALSGLQQVCHTAGLTTDQLGAVLSWYGGWMSTEVEAAQSGMQAQAVSQMETLRQSWGSNTERNMTIAQETVRRMFGHNPDFLRAVLKHNEDGSLVQVGTSPEMAEVFYQLGLSQGNEQFVQFEGNGLMSPAQAQGKIDEARRANLAGEITAEQLGQVITQYQRLASEG